MTRKHRCFYYRWKRRFWLSC